MEEVKIEYLENVAECTELEFWHECRSPVSITEARDLYRGCYVEKEITLKYAQDYPVCIQMMIWMRRQ